MAWAKQGNLKGMRGTKWFFMSGLPTDAANVTALNAQGAMAGDVFVNTDNQDYYLLS